MTSRLYGEFLDGIVKNLVRRNDAFSVIMHFRRRTGGPGLRDMSLLVRQRQDKLGTLACL